MAQTAAELEELIRSAIDDPAPWRVYADWLQSRGDPRGELITLQLRRESAMNTEARRRLDEAEAELLRQHASVLLGPITRELFSFEMCRGFVSALGPARPGFGDHRAAWRPVLESALQHSACRFLREYTLTGGTRFNHLPELEVLRSHLPTTVDRISMWFTMGDDIGTAILATLPGVKHLRAPGFDVVRPAVFPEVVSLRVHDHPSALLEFPKLESIDGGSISSQDGLPDFFNSGHSPRLRRARFGVYWDSVLWRLLVESRVVSQLKELAVWETTSRPVVLDELARTFLQYAKHLNHLERFTLFAPREHWHLFEDLQSALGEKLRLRDWALIESRQSLEFDAQWWAPDDAIPWDDAVRKPAAVETSPVQRPIRRRRPAAST